MCRMAIIFNGPKSITRARLLKAIIFGKNGQLGKSVTNALGGWGDIKAVGREDINLEDTAGLKEFIRNHKPDCIVNCAAFTAVDLAEKKPEVVNKVNAMAVNTMAKEAKKINSLLVHFSTDYVFNGDKDGQYYETDPISPINVYGKSKAAGEEYIRKVRCDHLILRSGWLYGRGSSNFPTRIIQRLNKGETCKVVSDCFGTPTSTEHLAIALRQMLDCLFLKPELKHNLLGTYHIAASGYTNWYDYAKLILKLGKEKGLIKSDKKLEILPVELRSLDSPAARPKNCRLNCDKLKNNFGIELADWAASFSEEFLKGKLNA